MSQQAARLGTCRIQKDPNRLVCPQPAWWCLGDTHSPVQLLEPSYTQTACTQFNPAQQEHKAAPATGPPTTQLMLPCHLAAPPPPCQNASPARPDTVVSRSPETPALLTTTVYSCTCNAQLYMRCTAAHTTPATHPPTCTQAYSPQQLLLTPSHTPILNQQHLKPPASLPLSLPAAAAAATAPSMGSPTKHAAGSRCSCMGSRNCSAQLLTYTNLLEQPGTASSISHCLPPRPSTSVPTGCHSPALLAHLLVSPTHVLLCLSHPHLSSPLPLLLHQPIYCHLITPLPLSHPIATHLHPSPNCHTATQKTFSPDPHPSVPLSSNLASVHLRCTSRVASLPAPLAQQPACRPTVSYNEPHPEPPPPKIKPLE
jgi:hypothetical protein